MKTKVLLALLISAVVQTPAWAAPVTGRVTYVDLSAHQLMLDNSVMYTVAPYVPPTGLEVGRLITADVSSRGGQKVITRVVTPP